MVPEEKSYAESGFVLNIVKPVIKAVCGGDISNNTLRKVAHFTEYAVFGGVLSCTAYWSEMKWKPLLVLGIGIVVAILDETIQIFSGRNSQIRDVLIDVAGVATAYAMVAVGAWIKRKRKNG